MHRGYGMASVQELQDEFAGLKMSSSASPDGSADFVSLCSVCATPTTKACQGCVGAFQKDNTTTMKQVSLVRSKIFRSWLMLKSYVLPRQAQNVPLYCFDRTVRLLIVMLTLRYGAALL